MKYSEERFLEAMKELAMTEDGQIFFHELGEYCRFGKDILAQEPIDTHTNAMLLRVYHHFKSFIPRNLMMEIEYNYERQEAKHGRNTSLRDKPSDKRTSDDRTNK